ncbi:hypothetical protein [Duganella sp. Leaf126]|uniref:hypothetical protein n=1 Tax=Duganella sp. Leaf126 TaxID=1736266 RepID=UPI000A685F9D|nr:hypothetical protein [Duganella sp. Leaf126]
MSLSMHPSKHLVRAWLARRKREMLPPPSPEEIRRQLGWGLMLFEPVLVPAKAASPRRR